MPTTEVKTREVQRRWDEIIQLSDLRDLPYKVETEASGKITLSPHKAEHADLQGDIIFLLQDRAPEGKIRPEFPVATEEGVKVADVAWMTESRREEMKSTGDPPTLAPEICVEVMSSANRWEEMVEKVGLYRRSGAKEVWIVREDGSVCFFADVERKVSKIVPDFPDQLE